MMLNTSMPIKTIGSFGNFIGFLSGLFIFILYLIEIFVFRKNYVVRQIRSQPNLLPAVGKGKHKSVSVKRVTDNKWVRRTVKIVAYYRMPETREMYPKLMSPSRYGKCLDYSAGIVLFYCFIICYRSVSIRGIGRAYFPYDNAFCCAVKALLGTRRMVG